MARQDPLRNARFRLEIDGLQVAGFSEVAVGATITETIDYREGNEPLRVRKLSGLTKFGNVSLKRGVTDSRELFDWHQQIVQGQLSTSRKNVVIVVLRGGGRRPGAFRSVQRLAYQIRSKRSECQGQRSFHRMPGARKRGHRTGFVSRARESVP